MVTRMNQLDPERQIPTLVYKKNLPSISFYRQKLAIMALARREKHALNKIRLTGSGLLILTQN